MRGKLYTFRRNGSKKFLYILPSACFATFPAIARAKSSSVHAMSGHQKVAKSALLWPLGCALPTPIASPDSPEFFSIRRPRKGRCLEPIKPIKINLPIRSPNLF